MACLDVGVGVVACVGFPALKSAVEDCVQLLEGRLGDWKNAGSSCLQGCFPMLVEGGSDGKELMVAAPAVMESKVAAVDAVLQDSREADTKTKPDDSLKCTGHFFMDNDSSTCSSHEKTEALDGDEAQGTQTLPDTCTSKVNPGHESGECTTISKLSPRSPRKSAEPLGNSIESSMAEESETERSPRSLNLAEEATPSSTVAKGAEIQTPQPEQEAHTGATNMLEQGADLVVSGLSEVRQFVAGPFVQVYSGFRCCGRARDSVSVDEKIKAFPGPHVASETLLGA